MKIPEKIGRYKIQKELGRGAMGVVFEAIDEDLDRTVAAKMLPKAFISNEEQSARFKQEAKIVAKLDHPNIMRVYAIEYAEDTIWIIMEYIQGRSLEAVLREKGFFSYSEALPLIMQMIKALGYAHSKGIVHRDIKPANIMVSPQNIIKIMDFGIARDEGADAGITRTGTVMGTPKYMSPEQFKAKGIDYRSDTYSLCVMIYEMLTGKTPFVAETFMEYAFKHLNDKPIPIRKKIANLPKDFDTFIMSSLSKNKVDRPNDLLRVSFSEEDKETIMLKKPNYKRINYAYIITIIILIIFLLFFTRNKKNDGLLLLLDEKPKVPIIISQTEEKINLPKEEEKVVDVEQELETKEVKLKEEIITFKEKDLNTGFLKEEKQDINAAVANKVTLQKQLDLEKKNNRLLYSFWKNHNIAELRDMLRKKTKSNNFTQIDYDDIASILEEYLNVLTIDALIIDTISWCIISIESSNNQKYLEELKKYDDDKVHKKIRGYAKRALKKFNFMPMTSTEKEKLSREDILILELQSEDFLKVRIAAKQIYIEKIKSESIMDEIVIFLTKYIANPVDDKNASDAIAYFCLILGESGKKDNIEILQTIKESDLGWKIKRYAKGAINMLEGKEKSFFSFLDF